MYFNCYKLSSFNSNINKALTQRYSQPRNNKLLLLTTATLLTPVLAANITVVVGTNCNIVANHTVIAGDILVNIVVSTNSNLSIHKSPSRGL